MSSPTETLEPPEDWWRLTDTELMTAMVKYEQEDCRRYGVKLAMIAEALARGLAASNKYHSPATMLRDLLHIGLGEARRRINHADAILPSRLINHVKAAPLAATGAAVQAGTISPEHVDIITTTISSLPTERERAEQELLHNATNFDPPALRRVAKHLRDTIDPDGKPPHDDDLKPPRNELTFRPLPDGRVVGRFDLDKEAGALLDAAISALAKPRPKDTRSTPERQGDALAELLRMVADSGGLPTEGGERPHLTVTVSWETLKTGLGKARLEGAGYLSAAEVRLLACDAKVIAAVLDAKSKPLDVASPKYVVPAHIRRALVLRDKGCAFPTCDRPARWCHAHHIKAWHDGGPTDMENLVLLCGEHHRFIHASDWSIAIVDGHATFYKPTSIDPNRTPLRNTMHG